MVHSCICFTFCALWAIWVTIHLTKIRQFQNRVTSFPQLWDTTTFFFLVCLAIDCVTTRWNQRPTDMAVPWEGFPVAAVELISQWLMVQYVNTRAGTSGQGITKFWSRTAVWRQKQYKPNSELFDCAVEYPHTLIHTLTGRLGRWRQTAGPLWRFGRWCSYSGWGC